MLRRISYLWLVLLTGCTLITEPQTPKPYSAEKVLDDTINLLDTHYPFLTFKDLHPDSLRALYLSKISRYEDDQVNQLLYDLLGDLKDGHVWFFTPAGVELKPYTPRRSIKDRYAFSLEVAKQYLDGKAQALRDGRIVYGVTQQDIGYIYLPTFRRQDNVWYKSFSDVIKILQNTRGLIIDVRSNGGGSDVVTYFIVRHFINKPFLSPIWLDPNGKELPREYLQPMQNPYLKPVVLLQNGTCFSATEGFICMMRELGQVVTLGDTTGGGSGAPKDFLISYQYKIHLSTIGQLTYEGKYIEWNGIEPDILLPQSQSDLENRQDPQLEKAISLLN